MSEPTPGQYLAAGAIVATHGPPDTRERLAAVLFDAANRAQEGGPPDAETQPQTSSEEDQS